MKPTNKSIVFLLIFLFFFLAGALSFIFNSNASWTSNMEEALQAPNSQYWLGTDSLGRDLWSRSLQGGFISCLVASWALLIAALLGLGMGFFSAVRGGWIDKILMRILELLISLPAVILIGIFFLRMQNFSRDNTWLTILQLGTAIGIIQSFALARWTRNLVLQQLALPYIESVQVLGASQIRIWFFHLLPNVLPLLSVYMMLQLPSFILFETAVSFFGFGLQAPTPSWGLLLQEGWKVTSQYPFILLGPAAVVFATMLSLYLFLSRWSRKLHPRYFGGQ